MLFKESDLVYNPIQEASNILNESVYLDESESVTSAKAIPVVENNRIGAYVVKFDDLSCLAEDHGMTFDEAMVTIAESNGIDPQNLAVAVKETTIMADPDIVNELCNVVVTPLPETDTMYQFTEACVDAFIESGDTYYMDLLVEETTKDEKIMDMIHKRAKKYEDKMDDKKFNIDANLTSSKLDMQTEQSKIKKLLKAVKHYGYNTPKALIQKAIVALRKKYNQILQNIPKDKSQQKWYQKILIVIEKTINKIGQYINFSKNVAKNSDLPKLNDILINSANQRLNNSRSDRERDINNQYLNQTINHVNKRTGARVAYRTDSDFKPFDYYDYD